MPPTPAAALIRQARRPPRPHWGQRQLQPQQVAAGYSVQAFNATVHVGVSGAAHALIRLGEGAAAVAAPAGGLLACAASPVESVKTLQDVRAGRRKARAAQRRVVQARRGLDTAGPTGDPVERARHALDRRHGLESWAATRRGFQGSEAQIRRRWKRWRTEWQRLNTAGVSTHAAAVRRQRLERRLEALEQLGPRRIARLRSSAVSVDKRLKEAISAGRQIGSATAAALALATGVAGGGASVALILLGTVFLPLILPVLLMVDGVAGSVEARQLIRRARNGLAQLHRGWQRVDQARRSLALAPSGSPVHLFRRGLDALQPLYGRQERQWQRDRRSALSKRVRSAAYVALAPILLGLTVAGLVALGATPVGWALLGVSLLAGAVAVVYGASQVVFHGQQAREARALRERQHDHAVLARPGRLDWRQRTALLDDPVWADNEYLAIELMVRSLVLTARDPAARGALEAVFRRDLRSSRRWTESVFQLASSLPQDAPPDHADVWRLSEALMRRLDLPVPKAGRRPGAV